MNVGHFVSKERSGVRTARRILLVVPSQWQVEEAVNVKNGIEDVGHHVSLLRADDMMGPDDIASAMPNKDFAFLFLNDRFRVSRARDAAQRHNVKFSVANIGIDGAVAHVLSNV
jgi:hypothetical protein